MNEQISDERLNEIRDCLIDFLAVGGLRKDPKVTDDELYYMAQELLSARRKIALLKEDAERLFVRARHYPGCPSYELYPEDVCTCGLSKLDRLHQQVMKEVE